MYFSEYFCFSFSDLLSRGSVLSNSDLLSGVVSLCAAAFVACFSAVNLGMSRLSVIVGSRSAFVLTVHVTSWLSSASGHCKVT